jgi:hypothetical protein
VLNYKHRAGSRRQLRIVHTNLQSAFAELSTKQRELPFAPLPEPADIPEDELTDTFKAAFGPLKSTDLDYLTRLAALGRRATRRRFARAARAMAPGQHS